MLFSKKIFVFWLLPLSGLLHSQERTLITGRIVIDVADNPEIEVRIINKNTGDIAYTNLYGKFSIRAQQNDILHFSSISLEKRDLALTKNLLQKKEIIVYLNADYAMLDTVTVYANRLTGNLRRDIKNALVKKKFDQKKIGLPDPKSTPRGQQEEKVFPSLFSFNFNAFYNLVSGKTKQRKALRRYNDQQKLIEKIEKYYGKKFFTQTLKIPEEKISDFLGFTLETSKLQTLYAEKNFFEIMQSLKNKRPDIPQHPKRRDKK